MTDVRQFGSNYIASIGNLINALETARQLQDRLVADPSLFAQYIASTPARTDLALADFQAAQSAVVQLLFAFDSGAPTQKSSLFKML